MHVYFDESGDLGWNFNKPYGYGGSSRFLTIAFLFVEPDLKSIPKRIVRDIYRIKGQSPAKELKGNKLSAQEKSIFISKVKAMLHKYETIKLASITVDKRNIAPHIRTDSNIIYNYMIKLILPDFIKTYPQVFLFPDPRSIKVKSANSMTDYLQIHLWFELGVITKLNKHTISSEQNLNIQFADFLAHIVWDSYEHGIITYRNQLSDVIDNRELFFHKTV